MRLPTAGERALAIKAQPQHKVPLDLGRILKAETSGVREEDTINHARLRSRSKTLARASDAGEEEGELSL